MWHSDVICIIDIGSTKICCCIASVLNNEIKVMGIGYCACTGIISGIIVEMDSVCKSISTAIELAESEAGMRAKSAYVSISGNKILQNVSQSKRNIGNRVIVESDIHDILYGNTNNDRSNIVLHKFPIIYGIDGLNGIRNPVGMVSSTLDSWISEITAPKAQVNNILVSLSKCRINADSVIASQYASGMALLSDKDNDGSFIIIEFSGSCTSLSFWYNGILSGIHVIPIGGGHITNEIAKKFCISYADAERLKVLYGSAINYEYEADDCVLAAILEKNEVIRIQHISKDIINSAVRLEIEKLVEMIAEYIEGSHFKGFSNDVIITGGVSQTPGLADLVAIKLRKNVLPRKVAISDKIYPHSYVTLAGMLKCALSDLNETQSTTHRFSIINSLLGRILQSIRRFFGL